MPRGLDSMKKGEKGKVAAFATDGAFRARAESVGLKTGATVECLGRAPLGDPVIYKVGATSFSIREKDARKVIIKE